jgi:transcriptional regulator with XRE-family HTH domain
MSDQDDHLMRDPLVRAFGMVLRSCRNARGLSRPQLAEALGCSPQWIEKLETAQKPPSEASADDFDTFFKVPRIFHNMWEEIDRLGRRKALPAWFKKWMEIEQQAHTLKHWQPLVIPGLLQTPEYAREIISRQPGITAEQIEEQLARRLERQSILTEDDPTMLFVILDEGVLHRPIGDATTMRDQLAHLLEMAARSNVTIQILPEEAGASCGNAGAFVIASLHNGSDAVYLESDCEGRVTAHPSDVITMSNRYAKISADALPERASLELISKVMKERWSAT